MAQMGLLFLLGGGSFGWGFTPLRTNLATFGWGFTPLRTNLATEGMSHTRMNNLSHDDSYHRVNFFTGGQYKKGEKTSSTPTPTLISHPPPSMPISLRRNFWDLRSPSSESRSSSEEEYGGEMEMQIGPMNGQIRRPDFPVEREGYNPFQWGGEEPLHPPEIIAAFPEREDGRGLRRESPPQMFERDPPADRPLRGRERLSNWISHRGGDRWYEDHRVRRMIERELRELIEGGATLWTTHIYPQNRLVNFDGFTLEGSSIAEVRPGLSVWRYFQGRRIGIDPLSPCVMDYGGYSQRRVRLHANLYPLDVLEIRRLPNQMGEENGQRLHRAPRHLRLGPIARAIIFLLFSSLKWEGSAFPHFPVSESMVGAVVQGHWLEPEPPLIVRAKMPSLDFTLLFMLFLITHSEPRRKGPEAREVLIYFPHQLIRPGALLQEAPPLTFALAGACRQSDRGKIDLSDFNHFISLPP
ncbi:hypothetical protein GPALN_014452 [Globodera pallida]|nr:hypothetical protein GPALN_014452 [Globodera pallida]